MTSVTIAQVIRRAEKGVTLPFLCQGDDGQRYWCKGNDAGKAALCCEWLAGRVAQAFGLPIPHFAQAAVPQELVDYSAMDGIQDLGSGIVFASEHVQGADELTLPCVHLIPPEVRLKVLVFDWWVQNEDRTLYETGGNVNVLWLPAVKEAMIIDHNVAFDPTFDMARFRSRHVFRGELDSKSDDELLEIAPLMADISKRIESYCSELPEEWISVAELSDEFSLARVKSVLDRFEDVDSLFGSETR